MPLALDLKLGAFSHAYTVGSVGMRVRCELGLTDWVVSRLTPQKETIISVQ